MSLHLFAGLRVRDLQSARAWYERLLGWRPQRVTSAGASGASYHALDLGAGFGGGVVECGTNRALWLPYVEVGNVTAETGRARGWERT